MTVRSWVGVEEDGPVTRVTLSRSPLNALNPELVAQFDAAVAHVRSRASAMVVHIRSDQRVFCAGGDLEFMRSLMTSGTPGPDMRRFVGKLQVALQTLASLPAISVCEINGAALGGGLEIALACDMRIASDRAKLGLPEIGLGLLPAAGGTQRLPRLVGPTNARRIILRSLVLEAEEARAIGLVDEVFPAETCAKDTRELIDRLLAQSRSALAAAKHCMALAHPSNTSGYELELDEIERLIGDAETRQRVEKFLARAS
jgi:enoyl-CoA hydratase